jgi:protein gp37
MGDKTGIEWTDATWNPVSGCSKVSQGCKHCYAEALFPRPYPGRKFTDVRCHPERLKQPICWARPRRIFVNSMSDLFHELVPFEFIDQVFGVMAATPRHAYQILTKRPERMLEYLSLATPGRMHRVWAAEAEFKRHERDGRVHVTWPLANVWLGVSVEDQENLEARLPLLQQTPAAIRFLSCEPLLGPLELKGVLSLDWIIVGGESGRDARPFNIEWARDLVRQCDQFDVPCFVKQLGASPHLQLSSSACVEPLSYIDRKGGDWDEWPADLRVRQFPKASA